MKKLLAILVVVFMSSSIMAQISFGPKLGYTSTELTTNGDVINNDMKSSLHFGAFARLGTKFYIQPEILWMTKGAKFKYNIGSGLTQDIKLSTIDIPLLVGMKVISDANWAFQIGAGVDALMFTLDVRYQIGLTNLYEGNLPERFDISDIKNNAFLVTLGWKIF